MRFGLKLAAAALPALALLLILSGCGRRLKTAPPDVASARIPPASQPHPPPQIPPQTPPEPPHQSVPSVEQRPAMIAPEPRAPYLGPAGVFEARQYLSAEGQDLPYRLFTPIGYDPAKKYPLVVFLHGASARGADNQRQLGGAGQWGTALWSSEETQQKYPAFVLAPQANRGDSRWVRRWRADPSRSPADKEPLELVIELVGALEREFSIDPDRLYITGLSMGGFGTWIAISRYPSLFAAAIPVCGGGDPADIGETTTNVWAFHGSADTLVPPRRSREMVEALRRAGVEARYTEYPGVGHNAWERAFREPELVDWLFAQRRQPPIAAAQ